MAMFGSKEPPRLETFGVKLPNGKTVTRQLPEGSTDEQVRAAFADAMRYVNIDSAKQAVQRPPSNEQQNRAALGDQGQLSTYSPPVTERIGNAVGGMFGSRNVGASLSTFLRDWTPLGNVDGITHGGELEQQLSMLPLPGPVRRVVTKGLGNAALPSNDTGDGLDTVRSLADTLGDPRPLSQMYQMGDVLKLGDEVGEVVSQTDAALVIKFPSGQRVVPRRQAGLEPAHHSLWPSP